MEMSEERGTIITEVFTAFGKPVKQEYISAALHITSTLTTAQLVGAVKYLVNQENFPQNVGYAIRKVAWQQMPSGSTYTAPGGITDESSCLAFIQLVIYCIGLRLKTDIYKGFWEFINGMWNKGVDQFERNNDRVLLKQTISAGYKALEPYKKSI